MIVKDLLMKCPINNHLLMRDIIKRYQWLVCIITLHVTALETSWPCSSSLICVYHTNKQLRVL